MTGKRKPGPRPAGRPRSERSKHAILKAAYGLLKKKGVASASTQELARAAGVSTATLYRWWKTKEAIMLDAFFEHLKPVLPYEGEGSPLDLLRSHVVRSAAWLHEEEGRIVIRLIGDVRENPRLHRLFLDHFYLPRRALQLRLIRKAIAAGELRPDTDADVLIDALLGTLYFRMIIGHAPLDKAFATSVATAILRSFTA